MNVCSCEEEGSGGKEKKNPDFRDEGQPWRYARAIEGRQGVMSSEEWKKNSSVNEND